MKIADTTTTNQLKFIENNPPPLRYQHHHVKRSLIPITTTTTSKLEKHSSVHLEKLEVKNLPKSGVSKVSINTIELDSTNTHTTSNNYNHKVPNRIAHYDVKPLNTTTSRSNLKRHETYHAKQTTTTTTGVKSYLSQLKTKTPLQLVKKKSSVSLEPDLKSQTILINKKHSLGQLNPKPSE